jgi:hypothetical protein
MYLFIVKGIIMDSPLKKFIEWYLSLPVPHRQSIVEFVIFFNIGFDDIDTTKMEDLHNAFVKKLSRYSHDKLKGTGLALMLRRVSSSGNCLSSRSNGYPRMRNGKN